MLLEMKINEFLDSVAGKSPTPAGGSSAALAGSLGACLTAMAGNLTIGRKSYSKLEEDLQEELEKSFRTAVMKIEVLNKLIQKDTDVYNELMEATKMPKATKKEESARRLAVEAATKKATEVPLAVATECLEILKLQRVFAEYGNPNIVADVGVGAILAYSGLESSLLNAAVNLRGISDRDYTRTLLKESLRIKEEGLRLKEHTLSVVHQKSA